MNKFRQLGFIDYNGKLEVHSSLLNVVLHDEPHIKRETRVPGRQEGGRDDGQGSTLTGRLAFLPWNHAGLSMPATHASEAM
jgi:hypothetical protein